MKLGILSDIHSNIHALKAVIKDAGEQVDHYVLLGDQFGYYPWACETYELLTQLPVLKALKGNHDTLMERPESLTESGTVESAISQNFEQLKQNNPAAIHWIESLPFQDSLSLDAVQINMCHGTPEDPENGRFYPDSKPDASWTPVKGEVLLLGHTHYPIHLIMENGGIILNPGSVGQPRDGNTDAAWAILDTETGEGSLKRTTYDFRKAITELEAMNWNKRAIFALGKNYHGPLIVPDEPQKGE